jgi:hypothetical protein
VKSGDSNFRCGLSGGYDKSLMFHYKFQATVVSGRLNVLKGLKRTNHMSTSSKTDNLVCLL